MSQIGPCIRVFVGLVFVTGLVYPMTLLFIGKFLLPYQSQGSIVQVASRTVGSALIGQQFKNPRYFWPRPSAVDYNPLPSGGSYLSPYSAKLKEEVGARKQKLSQQHPSQVSIPLDLLFSSASGVDPHISLAAAYYQVERVAKSWGTDEQKILDLIQRHREKRWLGFLGENRVNVLLLNIDLDKEFSTKPDNQLGSLFLEKIKFLPPRSPRTPRQKLISSVFSANSVVEIGHG